MMKSMRSMIPMLIIVELTSRKTGESEEMTPEAAVTRVVEIYAAHMVG